MNIQSNLFRLPFNQSVVGYCWVCEAKVLLCFRDATTGFAVGKCCLGHMLFADKELSLAAKVGIRHLSDQDEIPNH